MHSRRSAYTLLEVLLALAIAVLVMAAVYAVVGYQLKHAQAGREVVERATLARALFNRIGSDITAALAQNDPARYRRNANAGTGGGASPTAPAAATPGMNMTDMATTGMGMTGMAMADTSGSGETDASMEAVTEMPIELPLGVMGSATQLHLFVSKVPDLLGQQTQIPTPDASTGQVSALTSDLRRISYWLSAEGAGLCRFEARVITSDEATTPDVPTGDVTAHVLASEVRSLEFSYFDGTAWTDSWDSTAPGPDGTTPLGSPRLIAITVGIVPASMANQDVEPRYYRHVVAIPTAGGTPIDNSTTTAEGGTMP